MDSDQSKTVYIGELNDELKSAAHLWRKLGKEFELADEHMDAIVEDHPQEGPEMWMGCILDWKMRKTPGFGWKDIARALKNICESRLANKIYQKHSNAPAVDEIDEAHLMEVLCDDVDQWRQLGLQFGFKHNELNEIQKSRPHGGCKEWMLEMLSRKMRRTVGFGWDDIIKALSSIGCSETAAKISKQHCIHHPRASSGKDIVVLRLMESSESKLKRKFSSLIYFSVKQIEKKEEVAFLDFRSYVIACFSLGDYILEAHDYRQVFDYIGHEKKWDYLNFDPLLELLEEFIDEETRERRREYENAVTAYYTTRRLSETMEKNDLTKTHVCEQPDRQFPNYREICIKLHPHRVTEKSLNYVHQLWGSISRQFSLPSVNTILERMPSMNAEADCVCATLPYQANEEIRERMKENIQSSDRFMEANSIVEMTFDDGSAYSQVKCHSIRDADCPQPLEPCEEPKSKLTTAGPGILQIQPLEPCEEPKSKLTTAGPGILQIQPLEPCEEPKSKLTTAGPVPSKYAKSQQKGCEVLEPKRQRLQVFVEMLNGNRFSLYMDKRDTVGKMKLEIEKVKGPPPHTQRLIFTGKPLDDEKALDDYAIEDKSTVYLDSWIKAVQDTCTEYKRIDVKLHVTETTCMQQRAEAKVHVTETACVQQHAEAKLHVTETACEQQHANVVARELERVEEERDIAMQENQQLREALQSGHEARQEIEAALERRTLIMRDDLRTEREETRRLQEQAGKLREDKDSIKHDAERFHSSLISEQQARQEAQRELEHVRRYMVSSLALTEEERGTLMHRIEQLEQRSLAELTGADTACLNVPRREVELVDVIGVGAWGTVHRGEYRGQPVAVKCPHSIILTTATLARLERETQLMALVRHPNIVRIIATVFDNESHRLQAPPLIVTELMDINLRQCYEQGRLQRSRQMSIFLQIAYGLHHLHNFHEPIIHRDISAPNVLLQVMPDQQWRAKVGDFGAANLARLATTPGEGAIMYTAPESFPHTNIDSTTRTTYSSKSDVFSFGILVCEVACSQLPVPEHFSDMIEQVRRQSPSLHFLITSCIERNPDERPTMANVTDTLNTIPQPRPRHGV